MREPLAVLERAQFLRGVDQDVGIGAGANPSACLEKPQRRENAVAQIGFGDRTQSYNRAAYGQRIGFGIVQVGRVDQAPALIQPGMIEQPVDRALP